MPPLASRAQIPARVAVVVAEAAILVVAVTDVPVMEALSVELVKVVPAADAVPEVAATRTTTMLMEVTAVTIR